MGGGVVGLDLAILGDGYVYHTPRDDASHAPLEHIRALGVGTLSKARAMPYT